MKNNQLSFTIDSNCFYGLKCHMLFIIFIIYPVFFNVSLMYLNYLLDKKNDFNSHIGFYLAR